MKKIIRKTVLTLTAFMSVNSAFANSLQPTPEKAIANSLPPTPERAIANSLPPTPERAIANSLPPTFEGKVIRHHSIRFNALDTQRVRMS